MTDVGAERAVLSGLCQYGKESLYDICDIISVDSFTLENNKFLFKIATKILEYQDTIDITSIVLKSKELGIFERIANTNQDLELIRSLFNFPIDASNIRFYAKKIAKLEFVRKAQQKHKEAYDNLTKIKGNESIDEILSISESPIFDLIKEINTGKSSGPELLTSNIDELLERLIENPVELPGIPTPWKYYNKALGGGIRRGGVNLIASRPKIGKTTVAKEFALHFTIQLKIPVLFLDTEMVKEDQIFRALSSLSEVPHYLIETGQFGQNAEQKKKVLKAAKVLKDNPKFFYEKIAGKPFDEVLSIIRRWIIKEVGYDENGNVNNCIVIYDYFKLMDSNQLDKMQEYQVLGFQISKLSDFCKEYDFPCIAFVQLNRDGATKDSSEVISQSDRLLWLCHSFAIYRKKMPEELLTDGPQNGNRRIKVLDTRFGPGMDDDDYIHIGFNGEIAKVFEIGSKKSINNNKPPQPEGFELNDGFDKEELQL